MSQAAHGIVLSVRDGGGRGQRSGRKARQVDGFCPICAFLHAPTTARIKTHPRTCRRRAVRSHRWPHQGGDVLYADIDVRFTRFSAGMEPEQLVSD
jgi:hypothetical protein